MSEVRPYYLPSRRQLDDFSELLHPLLRSFAERWWPTVWNCAITAEEYIPANHSALGVVRYFYEVGDHRLLVIGSDKHWSQVTSGWLNCEIDLSSPLTEKLEREYCSELAAVMGQSGGFSKFNQLDVDKALAAYGRPGSGGIVVEITINNVVHRLLTTAAAFPHIFEQKETLSVSNLIDVTTALRDSSVVVEACLAPAVLPLVQVVAMKPGDFIDLGHDLSGRILLKGANVDLSLNAELGQSCSQKAAQVISIHRK